VAKLAPNGLKSKNIRRGSKDKYDPFVYAADNYNSNYFPNEDDLFADYQLHQLDTFSEIGAGVQNSTSRRARRVTPSASRLSSRGSRRPFTPTSSMNRLHRMNSKGSKRSKPHIQPYNKGRIYKSGSRKLTR
jgi:hypothetical protein